MSLKTVEVAVYRITYVTGAGYTSYIYHHNIISYLVRSYYNIHFNFESNFIFFKNKLARERI